MRISDWSADVCSSDLIEMLAQPVDGLADAVEAEGTVEQGRNQRGVLRPLGHDGEAHDLCSRRAVPGWFLWGNGQMRSEEHTSELQSLMRISYAVFCLKKKNINSSYNHNKRTRRLTARIRKY